MDSWADFEILASDLTPETLELFRACHRKWNPAFGQGHTQRHLVQWNRRLAEMFSSSAICLGGDLWSCIVQRKKFPAYYREGLICFAMWGVVAGILWIVAAATFWRRQWWWAVAATVAGSIVLVSGVR